MDDAGQGTCWSYNYGKRMSLSKLISSHNKDKEIKNLKARIKGLESRLRSK